MSVGGSTVSQGHDLQEVVLDDVADGAVSS